MRLVEREEEGLALVFLGLVLGLVLGLFGLLLELDRLDSRLCFSQLLASVRPPPLLR